MCQSTGELNAPLFETRPFDLYILFGCLLESKAKGEVKTVRTETQSVEKKLHAIEAVHVLDMPSSLFLHAGQCWGHNAGESKCIARRRLLKPPHD